MCDELFFVTIAIAIFAFAQWGENSKLKSEIDSLKRDLRWKR
jgi:hypothetical protein